MIEIFELENFPKVSLGEHIGSLIYKQIQNNSITIKENDIFCIASKIVSLSKKNIVYLDNVVPSELAKKIHEKVPRKDIRIIQTIIDVSGEDSGTNLEIFPNYIGAWLPNGNRLTSGGVDKYGSDAVITLPDDLDECAKEIGEYLIEKLNKNISIVITDSDGRIEKKGATQIAVGTYGIHPLRKMEYKDKGVVKQNIETLCDMIAGAAGLIMGQRGTNKPVVIIRGIRYYFDKKTSIKDALTRGEE